MTNRRNTMCLVMGLLVVLMSAVGCEQAAPPAAVVDLDAVAKAIGRDREIAQRLRDETRRLNEQLIEAADRMKQQLEAAQADLGPDATDQERQRLRQLIAQANQNVQNNKVLARVRQQQVRAELVRQFRLEIQPIARRIAQRRGVRLVLAPSETVLWFDAAADLTDEVIAELRSAAVDRALAEEPPPAETETPTGDQAPEPTPETDRQAENP